MTGQSMLELTVLTKGAAFSVAVVPGPFLASLVALNMVLSWARVLIVVVVEVGQSVHSVAGVSLLDGGQWCIWQVVL